MTDQQHPQDAARDELLRQIADTAKRTEGFNSQANRAEVLRNLAEAYAYAVSPNNSH